MIKEVLREARKGILARVRGNQQAEVVKDSGQKLPKVPPKDCESVH